MGVQGDVKIDAILNEQTLLKSLGIRFWTKRRWTHWAIGNTNQHI
jgi:hypothetical protein